MNIAVALAKIPWKQIINAAPSILEATRRLISVVKKGPTPDTGLRARIESLETNEAQQSELISQIAQQTKALSEGLQVVAARVSILLWVSISAVLLALILIVRELIT